MIDAHQVTKDFEKAIADYTGAPYVVTTNSCTMALLLALAWYNKNGGELVAMPSRTYPSVPMSAYHAGLEVEFVNEKWSGVYLITPCKVWDCAKRFTSGMYVAHQVQCVSFHAAKLLKIGQGGAILHDDPVADEWYRRMRFDGRTEGVPTSMDTFYEPGWHCYLSPDSAARGLWLMQHYPKDMQDDPPVDYPDMSKYKWQ
jgi:dTDP-4-amino-4,6-dideoxygalactose transaminase